jgi:ACR3 family arsenite efflux pump ArsB
MSQAVVPAATPKRLNSFERYLSVWVGACMVVGVCWDGPCP